MDNIYIDVLVEESKKKMEFIDRMVQTFSQSSVNKYKLYLVKGEHSRVVHEP